MGHDVLHHPLSQPLSLIFLENVDVAQVGKGGSVSDDASKADLPASMIEPDAKRALQRAPNQVDGDTFGPVGPGQVGVNRREIQPSRIVRDHKISALDFSLTHCPLHATPIKPYIGRTGVIAGSPTTARIAS